MPKKTQNTESI